MLAALRPGIVALLIAGCVVLPCLAPERAVAQGADWSGPYLGAGVIANRATATVRGSTGALPRAQGTGASLILGHGWQQGHLVTGVELALSRGNLNGQGPCGQPVRSCALSDNYYGAVRGRVGVAQGRGHGFVTLGVAHDRWEHRIGARRQIVRDRGLVAGVGAEYALRPRLSVRVDAEHMRMRPARRLDGTPARFRMNTLRVSVVGRH